MVGWEESNGIGASNLSDAATEAWSVADSPSGVVRTPAMDTASAALTTTSDSTGGQPFAECADTVAVSSEPTAIRTAAAYFGVHAIIDVSEVISAWQVGFAAAAESALLEEIHDGSRIAYGGSVDEQSAGDLLSSERFVDGVAAELLAGSDEPVAVMVCWDFAADTSMVLDVPSAVAQLYPAVLEISTIIDGYSAILIECYFPEMMTASYGVVEYVATPGIQRMTAVFSRAGGITAMIGGGEIVAVAGGKAVASLAAGSYIATKNED